MTFTFLHADGPFTPRMQKLEKFQPPPRPPIFNVGKIVKTVADFFPPLNIEYGGRGDFFRFLHARREVFPAKIPVLKMHFFTRKNMFHIFCVIFCHFCKCDFSMISSSSSMMRRRHRAVDASSSLSMMLRFMACGSRVARALLEGSSDGG